MAAAGASTSGECMLCAAGTYQTGSGQMEAVTIGVHIFPMNMLNSVSP